MGIFKERGIASNNLIFIAFSYYQSVRDFVICILKSTYYYSLCCSSLCIFAFLQGCTTADPIRYLYQYEDALQRGIYSVNLFLAKVDAIGAQEFSDRCGADVSSQIEGIAVIKDNLGILLDALRCVCPRFRRYSCFCFNVLQSLISNFDLLQINVRVGKLL